MVMRDPVLNSEGDVCEREYIAEWVQNKGLISPFSRKPLDGSLNPMRRDRVNIDNYLNQHSELFHFNPVGVSDSVSRQDKQDLVDALASNDLQAIEKFVNAHRELFADATDKKVFLPKESREALNKALADKDFAAIGKLLQQHPELYGGHESCAVYLPRSMWSALQNAISDYANALKLSGSPEQRKIAGNKAFAAFASLVERDPRLLKLTPQQSIELAMTLAGDDIPQANKHALTLALELGADKIAEYCREHMLDEAVAALPEPAKPSAAASADNTTATSSFHQAQAQRQSAPSSSSASAARAGSAALFSATARQRRDAAFAQAQQPVHEPTNDVEKLLRHVARGEQNQAKSMISGWFFKMPELLLERGTVTDYSGRTFEYVTAFQYALWALDRHMWEMILAVCPAQYKPELAKQLQELEEQGLGEHGKHWDVTPLRDAYNDFINAVNALERTDQWDDYLLDQLWLAIGAQQKLIPAHVANEYCHPDRSFDPTPDFKESTLPRVLRDYYEKFFFGEDLGSRFSFLRAGRAAAAVGGRVAIVWRPVAVGTADCRAVETLSVVRAQEYEQTKTTMVQLLQAAAPPQQRPPSASSSPSRRA